MPKLYVRKETDQRGMEIQNKRKLDGKRVSLFVRWWILGDQPTPSLTYEAMDMDLVVASRLILWGDETGPKKDSS